MSTRTADGDVAFDDRPSRHAVSPAIVVDAMATQMRVLNALILRETKTRYGGYKIGFLWALIEPAVSVSAFVMIFSLFRADGPSGMPLIAFMLTGFVPFALFRDPSNQMQGSISGSRMLLTFPQVTTFDVILARGLLEVAVTLFTFGFLLWLASLLGYEVRIERPLGVLLGCFLLATLGIGAGFIFASLEPLVPSIKQFTAQVLGRPLYFSSGLFFTAESLPPQALHYLQYNPLLHMIELVRGEFFHSFETTHGSWLYASAWSLGTLATGLVVHQAMRRRAVSTR